jgi:hypothetical protein
MGTTKDFTAPQLYNMQTTMLTSQNPIPTKILPYCRASASYPLFIDMSQTRESAADRRWTDMQV